MAKPEKPRYKNMVRIWTERRALESDCPLTIVWGLDLHNKEHELARYMEIPALALEERMVIVDALSDQGYPKDTHVAKEVEVIDKINGSCRGIHVNKKECYDLSAKVLVLA